MLVTVCTSLVACLLQSQLCRCIHFTGAIMEKDTGNRIIVFFQRQLILTFLGKKKFDEFSLLKLQNRICLYCKEILKCFLVDSTKTDDYIHVLHATCCRVRVGKHELRMVTGVVSKQ